jgi:hypothetical protein
VANQVRNTECEERNEDAKCTNSQMPEASQGAINLLTEQILKGGVPLFEERGTAFRFVVFRINIFRANDFLLELSFSGGGEFST